MMKEVRLSVVTGVFAAAIIAALVLFAINAGYYAYRSPGPTRNDTVPAAAAAPERPSPASDNFFLLDIFGTQDAVAAQTAEPWSERMLQITFRLLLAVIFSAVLAFRPRPNVPLFRRSLFVSQTQILLAVVAAALMMVVGDNAARAFAIFAAASLVRFRTNIRDPKEITVLLISLALGLAAGVGRWDLGISLCLFALALLWLLEHTEPENIFRSMEITIKTRDTERTQEILKKIFKRQGLDAEVRKIDPEDEENPIGAIVYYLNMPLRLTTDILSDRILNADEENIEKIQWAKTKNAQDIYK